MTDSCCAYESRHKRAKRNLDFVAKGVISPAVKPPLHPIPSPVGAVLRTLCPSPL